jgi:hypothetical protein
MLDNLHTHVTCLAHIYSGVLLSNKKACSFARLHRQKRRKKKQSDTCVYVWFYGLRFDQRLHCRQASCEHNRKEKNVRRLKIDDDMCTHV